MTDSDDFSDQISPLWRWLSLAAGVILFSAILFAPTPDGLTVPAQRLAAVSVVMALFWVFQPIPIAATSLLPLALYPLLNIASPADIGRAYGDQNIFLYLGGFLLAVAIEKWNLHRRIALHVLGRVGSHPRMIVFGFMAVTGLISMWISNTATALLMVPIGLALLTTLRDSLPPDDDGEGQRYIDRLSIPLLLGIAYAANCGGFATLVGTPTNISLRGFWDRQFVSQGMPSLAFAEWMLVFTPVSAIMLLACGLLMTWRLKTVAVASSLTRSFFLDQLRNMGRMTPAEWRVLILFLCTAALWVFREPLIIDGREVVPGWPGVLAAGVQKTTGVDASYLAANIKDATIAIAVSLLLFILPGNPDSQGRRPRLLSWNPAERRIPWGMLLLFGGGFAMADAFSSTHLSDWLGTRFAGLLAGQPLVVLIAGTCLLLTVLTEFTSNTAIINTLLPVLAAMAGPLNIDPRWLMIPATVAASCGFMMPVGTPPNTIVFATGRIPLSSMLLYGFALDLLGVVVVTAAMLLCGGSVLGIPAPG